ncbi:MAG: hypothetical protein WA731_15775 [Pseudonocardiaceae bacterium]|nr:hypothetical protein [Pseudonocardiaceae bacterium]
MVLGGKSEPLDVGRALRTVPLSIRRALVARDRGCAYPRVLLCDAHHRHVHHTGWEILIHPGHVEFIPPTIVDPTRTPLHNPLRC